MVTTLSAAELSPRAHVSHGSYQEHSETALSSYQPPAIYILSEGGIYSFILIELIPIMTFLTTISTLKLL